MFPSLAGNLRVVYDWIVNTLVGWPIQRRFHFDSIPSLCSLSHKVIVRKGILAPGKKAIKQTGTSHFGTMVK